MKFSNRHNAGHEPLPEAILEAVSSMPMLGSYAAAQPSNEKELFSVLCP